MEFVGKILTAEMVDVRKKKILVVVIIMVSVPQIVQEIVVTIAHVMITVEPVHVKIL